MPKFNHALLVDADLMSNMVNEESIQNSKFASRVRSYMDADAALDYLKHLVETDISNFPNVVFLDINMPVMNGWEFLEEIKKFPEFVLNQCKVFMLISSIEKKDIEKSKEYKMVYDFVYTPLTVEKIEKLFSRLPANNSF